MTAPFRLPSAGAPRNPFDDIPDEAAAPARPAQQNPFDETPVAKASGNPFDAIPDLGARDLERERHRAILARNEAGRQHDADVANAESFSSQLKAGGRDVVEAIKHPIETVKGMAAHAAQDVATLHMQGYEPGDVIDTGPIPKTDRETGKAALNTAALALLPLAPELSIVGRSAVNAGIGAANLPDEPVRGATAGLLLGEGLHRVAGGGSREADAPRVRLNDISEPLRNADFAKKLDAGVAEAVPGRTTIDKVERFQPTAVPSRPLKVNPRSPEGFTSSVNPFDEIPDVTPKKVAPLAIEDAASPLSRTADEANFTRELEAASTPDPDLVRGHVEDARQEELTRAAALRALTGIRRRPGGVKVEPSAPDAPALSLRGLLPDDVNDTRAAAPAPIADEVAASSPSAPAGEPPPTDVPMRNGYVDAVAGWWERQTPAERRKFILRGNDVYPSTPMSAELADVRYEQLPPHMQERIGIGYVQSRAPDLPRPASLRAAAPGAGNDALHQSLDEISAGVSGAGQHLERLASDIQNERAAADRGDLKASLRVERGGAAPSEPTPSYPEGMSMGGRESRIPAYKVPRLPSGEPRPLPEGVTADTIAAAAKLKPNQFRAHTTEQLANAAMETQAAIEEAQHNIALDGEASMKYDESHGLSVSDQSPAYRNKGKALERALARMAKIEREFALRGLQGSDLADVMQGARERHMEQAASDQDLRLGWDTHADPFETPPASRGAPAAGGNVVGEIPVNRGLVDDALSRPLPAGTPKPPAPLLNPKGFSPSVRAALADAERDLEARGITKTKVNLAEQRTQARSFAHQMADEIGISRLDLDPAKVGRLSGSEIVAIKEAATAEMDKITALSKQLADPMLPEAHRVGLLRMLEIAKETRDRALEAVVRASSQKGRDLNFLRQVAHRTLDPDVWMLQAKKALGNLPLTDDIVANLSKLVREAADACAGGGA